MRNRIFHRSKFASDLAQRLLEPNVLQTTSRDGLFLTGIRRIGKTTFLQQDLLPALEEKKALVIYVDLWSNRDGKTPTKQVLAAIRHAVEHLSTQGMGLKEVKLNFPLLNFTFKSDEVGRLDGISLADAFTEIITKINTNIVLVIDEIQEASRSSAGLDLLAALKAARDAVNLRVKNADGTYLLIVGTGSHRSLVSSMASRASQPFYGSDRLDFPLLDGEFIEWKINDLKENGIEKIPEKSILEKGFAILGNRPKVFQQILLSMQEYTGTELGSAFLLNCTTQARIDADEFLQPIKVSDMMTKLIFTEIARAGRSGCANFYSKTFLDSLSKKLNKSKRIPASSVQAKLARMQKLDWIYPISYGNYAVSDPQAAETWLHNLDDYLCEL